MLRSLPLHIHWQIINARVMSYFGLANCILELKVTSVPPLQYVSELDHFCTFIASSACVCLCAISVPWFKHEGLPLVLLVRQASCWTAPSSFLCLRKLFCALHLWEIASRHLIGSYSSSALNLSSHSLLIFRISADKSADVSMTVHLYMTS